MRKGLPKFALVLDGLFEGLELFRAEGDGDGLLGHFAGPLVTGAAGLEGGAVQDRALADVTDLGQALAQVLVLAFPDLERGGVFFHGDHFILDVKR